MHNKWIAALSQVLKGPFDQNFAIAQQSQPVSNGPRSVDIVDRSGLPYRLNPMGTVIEGSFDEVLALIARCHKAVMKDCERVSTIIKIDDRKGASKQLETKVEGVERRLGRKIRT